MPEQPDRLLDAARFLSKGNERTCDQIHGYLRRTEERLRNYSGGVMLYDATPRIAADYYKGTFIFGITENPQLFVDGSRISIKPYEHILDISRLDGRDRYSWGNEKNGLLVTGLFDPKNEIGSGVIGAQESFAGLLLGQQEIKDHMFNVYSLISKEIWCSRRVYRSRQFLQDASILMEGKLGFRIDELIERHLRRL